jgi:glycosyltransferase involved in cell wall biosynthesis
MNILLVSHNSFKKNNFFGGTEHLLKEIYDTSDEFGLKIYFMTPKIAKKTIKWEIHNGNEVVETFTQKRTTSEPYYYGSTEYSTWFSSILVKLNLGTLHIFHHLWIPLSSIPIAKNLGLTTLLTVHDFSHICDSFNLLDEKGEYCGVLESKDSLKCTECVTKRGSSVSNLTLLRASYSKVMYFVDFITVGTLFSKDHLVTFYDIDPEKIRIIPPSVKSLNRPKEINRSSILFLGNFTRAKGADLCLEILRSKRMENYNFIQAGRIDPEFRRPLEELSKTKSLKLYGQYKLGEVPDIKAEIAFFGSIWPETFCIAATEASQLGLKLVVPNIGAFVDRFIDDPNVYFYNYGEGGAAISALLKAASSEYRPVASIPSTSYADQMTTLYREQMAFDQISHDLGLYWNIPNLNLLGFKNSDEDYERNSAPSLVRVFRARVKKTGFRNALVDSFRYLLRLMR